MADTKISALAALTGANLAATDLFPVVDVSDATMAGSGTDKNITRDELIIGLAKAPTRQVLSVGSGTYTTPAGCVAIEVEVVAGGGGGGGAAQTGANAAAGSSGAAGGYARKLIAAPAATYAYTAGAKGTGGAAGNNNGTAGADSTFGAGGGLITAKGGNPGFGMAAGVTAAATRGGDSGGASTGGDLNAGGSGGLPSQRISGTLAIAGSGPGSVWGGGTLGRSTEGAGFTSTAPGGAGSGGCCLGTTAQAGGDGGDGKIIVTEYY